MKKLIIAATIICAAVVSQAAAVGWSAMNMASQNGNAYAVFVIGQNGVAEIQTITSILDAGNDYSSYVFGSGNVVNGRATITTENSGKTIGAGDWTEFMVVFDSATPVSGTSKYCVVAGAANQTQTVAAETAAITFAAGNCSSIVNNTANWKSYGSVPEPTSAMLLLLGVAGLALKRKVA